MRRTADQIVSNIISRPSRHSGDCPDCGYAKPGRRTGERSKMKELSMKLRELGRTHNNKGQAMVETALVLMLLVVLIFGMTEFGRAMYTKNTLNNAARAGARAAIVTNPLNSLTRTYPSFSTTDSIYNNIFGSLLYIDKTQVTATVCVVDNTGACTGKTPAGPGDPVNVTVTYTGFNSVVPRLIGPTGMIRLSSTLIGSATMRYE